MHDVLPQLRNDDIVAIAGMLVGVIAILSFAAVGAIAVLAGHFRRRQRDEMEATLKLEMIQRGMSADEIQQVLEARMDSRKGWGSCGHMASAPRHRSQPVSSGSGV